MTSRPITSPSALQVAQRVFALTAQEPTTLHLRGKDYGDDLPAGRVPLLCLRELLLRAEVSAATRDAVWAELIRRARADRSTWLVAAIGMAMPGLRRELRALTAYYRGDREDVESALAEGFVRELDRVDVSRNALCARLIDAARKSALAYIRRESAAERVGWAAPESQAPKPPWGHPDLVLVTAVRRGVLTRGEAELIAVTRLEGVGIDAIAAAQGERANTVVVRRHRAEHRLRDAIVAGRLEHHAGERA